jgi:hypothetical protein
MVPAPPPAQPAQPAEYAALHDARAVRDCAFFPLARLAAAVHGGWIVALMVPSSRSGSSRIQGAYIDGDTGRLVNPTGARPGLVKEGGWRAIAAAEGQPRQGVYSWSEPLGISRNLTEEDLYSPFAHGGVILFRPGSEGPAHGFEDVSLVFPEWGGLIERAIAFARTQPKLFQPGPWSPEDSKAAQELLRDPNEIIATMAFRGLVERRLMDAALMRATLEAAAGHRRAILIYAAMAFSPERSTPLLADEIVSVLATARAADELEPAALAAYAAFVFEPRPPFLMRRARQIIRAMTARLERLGSPPAPDSRLALLLKKLELPPEKQ